jgi:epoxide hydrolase A/B
LTIEDYEIQEFTRSGFRGGLNWYHNIDRMWEFPARLSGAQLQQPTLFVAGEVDAVLTMYPDAVAKLEQTIPNLTKKVILPGAGHWVQLEQPTEVTHYSSNFSKMSNQ